MILIVRRISKCGTA